MSSLRAGPSRLPLTPRHLLNHPPPPSRPVARQRRAIRGFHTSSHPRADYRPPAYPSAESPFGFIRETRRQILLRNTAGLRQFFKYCGYSFLFLGVSYYVALEGSHYYVETRCLPPTYPFDSSTPRSTGPTNNLDTKGDDEYGWREEMLGYTGGPNGGTDTRLGWKVRHTIRASWMASHWGAESQKVSLPSGGGLFEPDWMYLNRLQVDSTPVPSVNNTFVRIDAFLTAAIDGARKKGLIFPPELSIIRPSGPPKTFVQGSTSPPFSSSKVDPAAVDLLVLKARNLEDIASLPRLADAKEIYEQVAVVLPDATVADRARLMRVAKKLGDLCTRLGSREEAMEWWSWGLHSGGVDLDQVKKTAPSSSSSWFGLGNSSTPPPIDPKNMSPARLRATVSLLTSASIELATHGHLPEAEKVQSATLAMLSSTPSPVPLPITDDNAASTLHHLWMQHRHAMLSLYLSNVTYALKNHRHALHLAELASTEADATLTPLDPLPPTFSSPSTSLTPLSDPAKTLRRDTMLIAGEAAYTLGALMERGSRPDLNMVSDLYEKAMDLNAKESGRTEETAMGRDWHKYWRNFVRVKEKLGIEVESPFKPVEVEYDGMESVIWKRLEKVGWRLANLTSKVGLHLAPIAEVREQMEKQDEE